MNRISTDDIPDEDDRKFPVFLPNAYSELDTIEIQLPVFSDLEAAPEPVCIENGIGLYRTEYTFSPKKQLTYVREFACKERLIPVEQYQVYTDFLNDVAANDNRKFVFLKQ